LVGAVAALILVAGCATASPTPVPTAADSSEGSHDVVRSSAPATTQPNALSATTIDGLPGEPKPTLTPGVTNPAVTQANIRTTICTSGWTAKVRPPESYTEALKRNQIVAYGYADKKLGDYEEDHLISLEIGGAPRDPKNLWPEPYSVKLADGRAVGARVKDLVENRLHDRVCAGKLSLATAQREEATEWITVWFALDGQAPPPGIASIPTPIPTSQATPRPTAKPAPKPTPKPAPKPTSKPVSSTLKVAVTSFTSSVSPGEYATIAVRTKAGASCSIVVEYKSGPSKAQGLGPEKANSSGLASWTWLVGSRTTHGSWPVTVTCSSGGKSASAHASLGVH
jgi:hypothetical protein